MLGRWEFYFQVTWHRVLANWPVVGWCGHTQCTFVKPRPKQPPPQQQQLAGSAETEDDPAGWHDHWRNRSLVVGDVPYDPRIDVLTGVVNTLHGEAAALRELCQTGLRDLFHAMEGPATSQDGHLMLVKPSPETLAAKRNADQAEHAPARPARNVGTQDVDATTQQEGKANRDVVDRSAKSCMRIMIDMGC